TVRLTARPPERLFHLVLESHDGRAPGADSEEKHEPVSDIDTVVVDSLKALDPEWPIREADINRQASAFPLCANCGLMRVKQMTSSFDQLCCAERKTCGDLVADCLRRQ